MGLPRSGQMIPALALLALCGCGASIQVTRNPSASLASVRKVAVIPFGSTPAHGRITGEWETLLLSAGYRVIERGGVEALLGEQGLSINGLVNPEEAPRIGEILGVDGLVLGRPNPREPYHSYALTGAARISEPGPVSVKLVDAATARVVWSVNSEKGGSLNVTREGRAVNPQVRRSLLAALQEGGWETADSPGGETAAAVIAFNASLPVPAGLRAGAYAFAGGNDNGDGGAWADKAAGILLKAGYDIVDRQQLEKVIREQKLAAGGAVRPQEMARLGKLAGLKAVLMGTAYGGQVCAYHAKLVDVETGELYWSAYGEDCRMEQFRELLKKGGNR